MLGYFIRIFAVCFCVVFYSKPAFAQTYNPLSEVGDRALSWNFTSAQDIPTDVLLNVNNRLMSLGLPEKYDSFFTVRKIFNSRKTEFWYAIRICPKSEPECLTTSSAPYLAIVNFKRDEYILFQAYAGGKGRICINTAPSNRCRSIDNYGHPWPLTLEYFFGVNFYDGVKLFYNWAHIWPNSNSIISGCIKKAAYDKSVTYQVYKDDGYGWRSNGLYTDPNRGIDIKNVCSYPVYVLQRSNLTGSGVTRIDPSDSYQTIAFDYEIELYAVSNMTPF